MKLMIYSTAIFATSGIPAILNYFGLPIPTEIGFLSAIGGAIVAGIIAAVCAIGQVIELVKAVAEAVKH